MLENILNSVKEVESDGKMIIKEAEEEAKNRVDQAIAISKQMEIECMEKIKILESQYLEELRDQMEAHRILCEQEAEKSVIELKSLAETKKEDVQNMVRAMFG